MIDYYLKFSTEQEAFQAFQEAGYTSQDENGNEFVISATHDYCVDLIGTITEGGKWEYQGEEFVMTEAPVTLPGYHVNVRILRGDIAENLKQFVINTPQTPYRIFG